MNFNKIFLFSLIVLILMSVTFAVDVNDTTSREESSEVIDSIINSDSADEYQPTDDNNNNNNIVKEKTNKVIKQDNENVEEVNVTSSNFKNYFITMSKEVYMGKMITQTNNSLILNIKYLPDNIKCISIDESSSRFNNLTLTLNFSSTLKLNNVGLYISSNFKTITVENFNSTIDNGFTGNDYLTVDSNVQECVLRNITLIMNKDDVSSENVVNLCAKTTLVNSYIQARLMETNIDWNSGPMIPDAIGVVIQASGCELRNNTINIISSGNNGGSYYSLYALYSRYSNTLLANNNITLTNVTGYAYGLVFRSSNNRITGNNITVVSHTYSNGVNFEMSMFKNNLVDNNYVNVTASYGNAPWGNFAVAYALQMLDFNYNGGLFNDGGNHPNNNSYINNTLVGSAGQIYAIEIYGTCNTILSGNKINITGRTPMGIGVIGTNITISDNYVINNGTHNSSEGTADYLEAINVGLYAYKSFQGINIINNTIISENGPAIQVKESNNVNVTGNTASVTGHDYSVELTRNARANLIENNRLYSRNHKGDKSVYGQENNIVQNNLPEPNPLIDTQISLQTNNNTMNCGEKRIITGTFSTNNSTITSYFDVINVYDNSQILTTINGKDESTFQYEYTTLIEGIHDITFKYNGNDTHAPTESSITITVTEAVKEYTLTVNTTEFTAGQNATITANIYYGNEYNTEIATNINKGKITFKVNNKTLKDANGKVIYAKIVNGTATIENYPIPESWKEGSTIQAVYSGSSDVTKMSSEKQEITITASQPIITTEDITTQAGATITLKATLSDNTINTGKIVFKVNGKTVKDSNGKVIYAKVINGTASIEYTIPKTMKTGNYTITVVFTAVGYDKLTDNKTLTVNA